MSPSYLLYAVLAGLLPSLIWLFFWLREDSLNPEPRFLLALTFFGGMLAVVAAVFVEGWIGGLTNDTQLKYTLWAVAEEVLKFAAVFTIALTTSYNDEPIDAMVYCIIVALGFAALENTFFIFGPLSQGEVASSIITGNMRFIGATIVHVVSSASVGFALGLTFYRGVLAKTVGIIVGLTIAVALHASFNLSIISAVTSGDALKTFGWFWLAIVILIILFEEVKAVKAKVA